MADAGETTQKRILSAARREFLARGFQAASLRSIVRDAGVTTGAFYGYYKSKEALFSALVEREYETLLGRYRQVQAEFARLPPEEQRARMDGYAGECMDWMLDYAYDHLDAFRLILCRSEGTRYENLVHEMAETEVRSTHDFARVLRGLGIDARDLDPQLEHMLVSGMFAAFFEVVVHHMPRARAHAYVRELRAFYTAGWQKIMGF